MSTPESSSEIIANVLGGSDPDALEASRIFSEGKRIADENMIAKGFRIAQDILLASEASSWSHAFCIAIKRHEPDGEDPRDRHVMGEVHRLRIVHARSLMTPKERREVQAHFKSPEEHKNIYIRNAHGSLVDWSDVVDKLKSARVVVANIFKEILMTVAEAIGSYLVDKLLGTRVPEPSSGSDDEPASPQV